MFQILITLLIYMVLVIPIGIYLYHVATKQRTFVDPVFDRIDGMIYRICRINREDMHWKTYALNLLMTNAVMILIGYLVLRLQGLLFLNPNGIASMEESLSFNTIISFMTNTNLQHYSGESGLSYLSQTAVIIFMMFTSAATGYAACMAFCRGIAGRPMGNFYEDMVRNTTRILIPLSFIAGMLLIWQGTPQNFHANFTVSTLEGKWQDIAAGPIAALEAIKHVGTNGGGFLGANSSTPLENPTIISNLVELYSMMILPGACVIAFGNMIADKRKKKGKIALRQTGQNSLCRHGNYFSDWSYGMFRAESAGNPVLAGIGLNQDMGSYEGKEVRFGIAQSALFTTTTTSFTTGTVNNMHDSLTPLGGLVPLLHMMLNCVFGGKGVGLMNMVMYVILAVFICGLMIGRTPEYLGKKIEGKEMKLVAVCLIIHPLLILGFSALAVSTAGGLAGITNPGFHGLSQVLYEYSSSAANNGSGFEGLADNSVFWNLTAGIAMYFGRFPAIILQLAIAGSIFAKRRVNETVGTLRTDNVVFTLILVFVVYIFAALTFFPALALGPVAEHLTIWFPGLS
ncbi:MAG: potassium-transporting ATPase subunit KdpA [[Clostridium] symbiosum]